MERCEHRAFFELCDYLVGYHLAAHELLCSVHHAMSYRLDVLKSGEASCLLVKKCIHHRSDSYSVVFNWHFLDELFLSCRLVFEATCFHSDSLDKTLGEKVVDFVALHIKELILKR